MVINNPIYNTTKVLLLKCTLSHITH